MKTYVRLLMAVSCVLLSQGKSNSAEEEEEVRLVILEVKDEYGKTTFEVKPDSEEREWREQQKRNIKSNDEAQKYLQEYAERLKKVTRTKRVER